MALALVVTGLSIIATSFWRIRRTRKYKFLENRLGLCLEATEQKAHTSADTTMCFSQRWLIDNLVIRSHSRLGSILQQKLADNTFQTVLLLGLALAFVTLTAGVLFVSSIAAFGGGVLVFLTGMLVAVGPDEPRILESLLSAVEKQEVQDLTREDYAYVRLANSSLAKWTLASLAVGFFFIIVAPLGDLLPQGIAAVIAFMTTYLIFYPALILAEITPALAFLYVALVASLVFYAVPKMLISTLRRKREPESRKQLLSDLHIEGSDGKE